VPTLKAALDDSALEVRVQAARLLRVMGDSSGLARMQKDYAALVPDGGMSDPDISKLTGRDQEKATQKIRWRNVQAMQVARVLAEYEDHRGFELAAKVALDNEEIPWTRGDAVLVLVEIGVDDAALLKAENRDPLPVLLMVARSETDPLVLKRQADATMDLKMNRDSALEVLRQLQTSSCLREDTRTAIAYYIEKLTQTKASAATVGAARSGTKE
jgi:hypothetical protein